MMKSMRIHDRTHMRTHVSTTSHMVQCWSRRNQLRVMAHSIRQVVHISIIVRIVLCGVTRRSSVWCCSTHVVMMMMIISPWLHATTSSHQIRRYRSRAPNWAVWTMRKYFISSFTFFSNFKSNTNLELLLALMMGALVEGLGSGGGLYGESRLMAGGDTDEVEPDAGGLLDFFGRLLFPFEFPFCCCCCCWRHFALRFLNQTYEYVHVIKTNSENYGFINLLTWTLDSGSAIFSATSSLIKMSGYLVFPNRFSRMSNWFLVKVVRSRRCFRGAGLGPPGDTVPG